MKKILSLCVVLLLFFSCKKSEKLNPDAIRLVRVDWSGASDEVYRSMLDYDAMGRITKLSFTVNDGPQVITTVEYSGNEVILHYPVSPIVTLHDVKFLLGVNGKPVKRIQLERYEFSGQPQRDFLQDTLNYEYDANGFLMRATGHSHDSTWYLPTSGGQSTSVADTDTYIDYTTENNNLSRIKKSTSKFGKTVSAQGTFPYASSSEEESVFTYNKRFSNRTDFSNDFLLTEFGLLSADGGYVLNSHYANMPDEVSFTRIEKDAAGDVVSTDNYDASFSQKQNVLGYITGGGISSYLGKSEQKYTYKWH